MHSRVECGAYVLIYVLLTIISRQIVSRQIVTQSVNMQGEVDDIGGQNCCGAFLVMPFLSVLPLIE